MPQAKVIGGGSSINAEVFTRGHPADYDRWASEEGCAGWSFEDVGSPISCGPRATRSSPATWHGTDGPLGVSNIPDPQPMTRAFVQSCQQFGMPYNPDFNGPVQEGAGVYQTTTRTAPLFGRGRISQAGAAPAEPDREDRLPASAA